MARAYYNEFDGRAAAWLRNLIAAGLIADGDVDERSICDVRPADLEGYTQVHFFAGIGGWPGAARLAGWPDDRPLWTGSCPCQPFSVAGKGGGTDDVRHLWPDMLRLVRACRPAVVMGEQVAGKAGYGWFDGVRSDLEREDYACRAVDIPACAVDAPHIRSRLYWLAVADIGCVHSSSSGMADADGGRCNGRAIVAQRGSQGRATHGRTDARSMVDTARERRGQGQSEPILRRGRAAATEPDALFWRDHDWILCHDGKARRTEPGASMLVAGLSGAVAVLRSGEIVTADEGQARQAHGEPIRWISRTAAWKGFGNAINLRLAAEVLAAHLDVT